MTLIAAKTAVGKKTGTTGIRINSVAGRPQGRPLSVSMASP
jgi:hypothetical protein